MATLGARGGDWLLTQASYAGRPVQPLLSLPRSVAIKSSSASMIFCMVFCPSGLAVLTRGGIHQCNAPASDFGFAAIVHWLEASSVAVAPRTSVDFLPTVRAGLSANSLRRSRRLLSDPSVATLQACLGVLVQPGRARACRHCILRDHWHRGFVRRWGSDNDEERKGSDREHLRAS